MAQDQFDLNLSSGLTRVSYPEFSAYSIIKAAVEVLIAPSPRGFCGAVGKMNNENQPLRNEEREDFSDLSSCSSFLSG